VKEETLYEKLLVDLVKNERGLAQSNRESDLLPDNLTEQQRKRDKSTTELYSQFISAHKTKHSFINKSKIVILIVCGVWVSCLIATCIGLSVYIVKNTERTVQDIVALIAAMAPILTAIIGTLNIVTKHVFPEDEEKHITEIVKTILSNDLQNKQENIKRTKTDNFANE